MLLRKNPYRTGAFLLWLLKRSQVVPCLETQTSAIICESNMGTNDATNRKLAKYDQDNRQVSVFRFRFRLRTCARRAQAVEQFTGFIFLKKRPDKLSFRTKREIF